MKLLSIVARAPGASFLISGCGRFLRALGLMGFGISAAVPAPAQPRAPLNVPEHWSRYANLAGRQLQDALSDSMNDSVLRLYRWRQAHLLHEDPAADRLTLVAKVWVGTNGKVERVGLETVGDLRVDEDLRSVLTGYRFSEPPPRDMRQPIVLELILSE